MIRPHHHPFRLTLIALLGAFVVALALIVLGGAYGRAHAGTLTALATALPTELHDPVTSSPLDTISDLVSSRDAGLGVLSVAVAIGLIRVLTRLPKVGSWLSQGTRATFVGGALGVLTMAVWPALASGRGWTGALFAGVAWLLAHLQPTVQVPAARAPQSGCAALTMLALVAAVGLGLGLHTGCATLRSSTAAGVRALLDCETPDLTAVAADGYRVGLVQLPAWIDGSGGVDTSALKASLATLRSDQARCFEAGLVAAVLASATTPTKPSAAAAAPLVIDGRTLRATVAEARAAWGVSSVRVAGQVL